MTGGGWGHGQCRAGGMPPPPPAVRPSAMCHSAAMPFCHTLRLRPRRPRGCCPAPPGQPLDHDWRGGHCPHTSPPLCPPKIGLNGSCQAPHSTRAVRPAPHATSGGARAEAQPPNALLDRTGRAEHWPHPPAHFARSTTVDRTRARPVLFMGLPCRTGLGPRGPGCVAATTEAPRPQSRGLRQRGNPHPPPE